MKKSILGSFIEEKKLSILVKKSNLLIESDWGFTKTETTDIEIKAEATPIQTLDEIKGWNSPFPSNSNIWDITLSVNPCEGFRTNPFSIALFNNLSISAKLINYK